MSKAKITLFGFYKFFKFNEKDLFEFFVLPENCDKQNIIDNILLEAGEFEPLYTNPEFYREAIGVFARKHIKEFEKIFNALNLEYNPIENYDRFEDIKDVYSNKSNGSESSNSNSNQINKKSAFDSNIMQDDTSTGVNANASGTNQNSNNGENVHSARIHGNIGVTTNQQMLESELNLRKNNTFCQIVTDMFIRELTIGVY